MKRIAVDPFEARRLMLEEWQVAAHQFVLGSKEFLDYVQATIRTAESLCKARRFFDGSEDSGSIEAKRVLSTVSMGLEVTRAAVVGGGRQGVSPLEMQGAIENVLLSHRASFRTYGTSLSRLSYRNDLITLSEALQELAKRMGLPEKVIKRPLEKRFAKIRKERKLSFR